MPLLEQSDRVEFFDLPKREFASDAARVLAAARAYPHEQTLGNKKPRTHVTEPPRQELLRRLNRAP